MNFSQDITNYTAEGRRKIHNSLEAVTGMQLEALARGRDQNESIEYNDNCISVFVIQQGNCYITGEKLNVHDMRCFRKKPLSKGGTNGHGNIAFVEGKVFKLIFCSDRKEAMKLLSKLKLDDTRKNKLNKIRQNYGYQTI